MNHQNWKSLERALSRLDRRDRRSGRRVTPASVALVAGLLLGYVLLTYLIPRSWPVLLANDPGESLRGWPLLVWSWAMYSLHHETAFLGGLLAVSSIVMVLSYRHRGVRPLVWVAALGVMCADAGILASTILACLDAAQTAI